MKITLTEFLNKHYPDSAKSLTKHSAQMFGIPYPLPRNWVRRYANNLCDESLLTIGKRLSRKPDPKPDPPQKRLITGPSIFISPCDCNVLPWEDCLHTIAKVP